MKRIKTSKNASGYLFILPWLFGFIVLTLGPMLFSLVASFTNYDVTSRFQVIGVANYVQMFTQDTLFWTSVYNTLYYVLFSVPISIAFTIFIAYLLRKQRKGVRLFRTIYFLPSVLSGVGVYILWMQLLDPSTGLVNVFLSWFGIRGPAWLTNPAWTKNALIMMKLWGVGGGMLMYIAGMNGIDDAYYEAASLEGAGKVRQFFKITLPLISPVIFFDLVTSLIGGFQIFQEAYVMSVNASGGPANSLLFYNLYMWNKAFKSFDMGYAMAMSWLLFIVVMILTALNFWLGKRFVHYEGGEN